MQIATHPMAGVVLHHGIAMGLHMVLNGSGDIKQGVASFDAAKAFH